MTANRILDWARAQLGVKERPAGSNKVKYNTDYYGRAVSGAAYPWCMAFVWDGFRLCGASALLYGIKTAYCPEMVNAFRAHGAWVTGGFQPGDVVFYDWDGDGVADHVGIVERATAGGVVAIEGNTAIGNDSNGGEVLRRTRSSKAILGAGRPRYEEDDEMSRQEVQKMIDDAIRSYASGEGKNPSAWASGSWKKATEAGVTDGERPRAPMTREEGIVLLDRCGLIGK